MTTKHFDLEQAIKNILTIGGIDAHMIYCEAYSEFPSAKNLIGEPYRNFMNHKQRKSYEKVRESYPEMPEL